MRDIAIFQQLRGGCPFLWPLARESASIHPLPCFDQFSEGRTLRNAFRQLASFNKLSQDVVVMGNTVQVRTLSLRELIAAKFGIGNRKLAGGIVDFG